MDLPGWQALREKLHPRGVEIVTVALDTEGVEHAGPWIDAAHPTHPALIDRAHLVDELLGIVNVPNAVWLDETGTIVRPAEPAWPGSTPILQALDTPGELPPEAAATREHIARMHIDPERYLAMLLDWVDKGAESRFALSTDEVIARSRPRSLDLARAAAHFELGQHLHRGGEHTAAIGHWRESHRLDPDNWTYKRQAWNLETGDTVTQSDAYDGSWLTDVEAIGAENYYPKLHP
jgi:hypothetical protein